MNTKNTQIMEHSTLTLGLALLMTGGPVLAQIPNTGFEEWTDFGTYEDPTGWSSLNILTVTMGDVPTCERVAPGYAGDHAVRVMTADVPGLGVMPGMLLSGSPTAEVDGFPFTLRPEALTGMWKAEVGEGDAAMVGLTLWRWDDDLGEREVIGTGEVLVSSDVAEWTAFTVGIEYTSAATPDSASIAILSSMGSGTVGSSITVDDLAFSMGGGTAIAGMYAGPVSIHPVPAHDMLHVVTAGSVIQRVELWSMDGRLVRGEGVGAEHVVLGMDGLAPGAYALLARMSDGAELRRTVMKE